MHEYDPDGQISVWQGGRELFRCTPERHRLLSAAMELEDQEDVPGESS
jgi:hypothetical protein